MSISAETSEYENEDEHWDTMVRGLNRRKRRKGRRGGRPSPAPDRVRPTLTDVSDDASDFVPSYAAALDPLHHERSWLIRSLGSFYQDNLITDVTRIVKGGKEANVYCCLGNAETTLDLLAAKLYRPRMLRHLRNDAVYKEGRHTLDAEGKTVFKTREARALRKKTRFGKSLDFATWIMHEYHVHQELYAAGADVPQPVAQRGNTILMAFVGEEWSPAPTLSEVAIDRAEARQLHERIMANVRLMLSHHYVHADLSAYNILYWEGQVTIIDFPQVVDARVNRNALDFLTRDVQRVDEYFSRFGVSADTTAFALDLWDDYMSGLL